MTQRNFEHIQSAPPRFRDRREAGRLLAGLLNEYEHREGALVLGIPRGGMPVAMEVAEALSLPLDVLVVQRVVLAVHSAWQEPPLAGAIAHDGVKIIDRRHFTDLHLPPEELEEAIVTAGHELERRETLYRNGCPFPELAGRTVILVDDGIENGITMRTAIAAVRAMHAKEIVVAVPLGNANACREFAGLADKVVCPMQLPQFASIHSRYDDYDKIGDEEVRALIEAELRERGSLHPAASHASYKA